MKQEDMVNRIALDVIAESEKQKKYQDYFDGKLKKYDVDSPSELSDEEKKKFFDEVDKDYDAENESD